MSGSRPRALVLAAGYGTRLRPLTHFLPKPLLPVCGQAVAGRTLEALGQAGCEGVALNLHHLTRELKDHFGPSWHGLELTYSVEAEILGTLGALVPLRDYLGEAEAILLINGDALCEWPLEELLRRHFETGAEATMLLAGKIAAETFGGGVGIDSDGRVVQLRDGEAIGPIRRRHVFAGAHVLSPHLLSGVQPGFADIIAGLYMPLLEEGGHVASLVTNAPWHDLGNPERYLGAGLDWARRLRWWSWRGREDSRPEGVHPGAQVNKSMVEPDVRIEEGAQVNASLALPGARIRAGARVEGSILGPGVTLPPTASIDGRLVTRLHPAHPPEGRQTVMGELVYTPL